MSDGGGMGVVSASGGFRVIYADPPWSFRTWSETNQLKSPARHYPLMKTEAIAALPVRALAARDAALFIWVIQPMLPEALAVIEAWGFTFKTVAFAWVKLKGRQDRLFYAGEDVRLGLGYHTRSGFEQCWLATRGGGYERLTRSEPQVCFAPTREHSRKPDEIADAIVRLTGGPRIELFARQRRVGFDAWGNQVDKFADASKLSPRGTAAGGLPVDCASPASAGGALFSPEAS